MQAFMQTMNDGKRRYFDKIHGTNRIQLQVLATHPDYQRRGFGTRLCNWGIDLAKSKDIYIIVFGSPMGRTLYSSLGFRELAQLPVQAKGEVEKIVLTMMAYKSPGVEGN
jgi:GNAT superfamily N-acetyltransferase